MRLFPKLKQKGAILKMNIFKEEARDLGLTLGRVGVLIGVSNKTITQWVNGVCRPRPGNVLKLKELGFSQKAIANPSREVD